MSAEHGLRKMRAGIFPVLVCLAFLSSALAGQNPEEKEPIRALLILPKAEKIQGVKVLPGEIYILNQGKEEVRVSQKWIVETALCWRMYDTHMKPVVGESGFGKGSAGIFPEVEKETDWINLTPGMSLHFDVLLDVDGGDMEKPGIYSISVHFLGMLKQSGNSVRECSVWTSSCIMVVHPKKLK